MEARRASYCCGLVLGVAIGVATAHVAFQSRRAASADSAPEVPFLEDPSPGLTEFAAMSGTDPASYTREAPGMSAFALEDGVVYHTYSAFARGVDALWGMYQWLDRAPLGRNDTGLWFRRRDEYGPD